MPASASAGLGNTVLVKEQVGLFKAASNYDVFDPTTRRQILARREPRLGTFTKLLRFTGYKRMTPFGVEVRTPTGDLALQVTRGVSLLLSRIQVKDGAGATLGSFEQKLFSIGGAALRARARP
jgi:hypothetical protein